VTTPFDHFIEKIEEARYHNHRGESHSDIVCDELWADLLKRCPSFASDAKSGLIKPWFNVDVDGLNHAVDMMVCSTDGPDAPDLARARLCMENKSVITAHSKNRKNRHGNLNDFWQVVQAKKPEVVIVGSVLIGTADRVLNVPDRVKRGCRLLGIDFDTDVLPRLSTGDQTLWDVIPESASKNAANAAEKTYQKMSSLPVKPHGRTHEQGFDALFLAPVFVNNVDPPYVDRKNGFGLDVDWSYDHGVERICKAYTARWHTLS